MRVYHFVPENFGIENLRHKRMKIALLGELNDPFEWLAVACTSRERRKAFQDTKDRMARNKGLLCFSKSWRNPVQWSHYAERHKGICLGFDVPDALLTKVKYQNRRINPDWQQFDRNSVYREALMRQAIVTKFSHWRYEQEFRLFVQIDPETEEDGKFFYSFDESLKLAEVIVGQQCPATRANISEAIGSSVATVQVRKARLSFREFKIVTQRDTSKW